MRNLIRYQKYSRKEVHDIFSPNTNFIPGTGTWGAQGIIRVPETKCDYVFFVTYGQVQADHVFDENIDENGIFHVLMCCCIQCDVMILVYSDGEKYPKYCSIKSNGGVKVEPRFTTSQRYSRK